MRPQLGSPPWSAALTSGELATARAAASTVGSWPPLTTMRPTRAAPSPSRTISSASRRSTASSASPKRSSSSDSGATRTPLAPLAIRIAVSLVESWPSTEMRSKERFTHTPSSRSAVSGSSAASVWTKQSIVAKSGEIIPAPLACAVRRTLPLGSVTSSGGRKRSVLGPVALMHQRLLDQRAARDLRRVGVDLGGDHQPAAADRLHAAAARAAPRTAARPSRRRARAAPGRRGRRAPRWRRPRPAGCPRTSSRGRRARRRRPARAS